VGLEESVTMNPLPTIAEVAPLIRDRKIAPRELVEECLARIDEFEPAIRAWVAVDADGALRAADEAGVRIAEGGYRGPLDGIPVGIKDIIDVSGMPTKAGSPTRDNHCAMADAPLVTALREAGAIVLGKTVTVEFACFDPSPTRNPWDAELKHTSGGSSSGSAAALALGMCYGSIGTQTGGSLVRPSSYCGTATLKPTFGRLSREGIVPVSFHLDHPGPMARSVADLRVLYTALLTAKPERFFNVCHWRPASAAGGKTKDEADTARHGQDARGTRQDSCGNRRPLRLGIVEPLYPSQAEEPVCEVFDDVLLQLRASGVEIVSATLPGGFDEVLPMHRRIMAVEAAEYHRQSFGKHRDLYGPKIAALLDEGLTISGVDYAAALAWQRDFANRVCGLFSDVDALIMPSTDTTAPPTLETTGTPKFQALWSCAGVPVVSIPCGLARDRMPVGLQIIRRHGSELALVDIAERCEKLIAFSELPPMLEE
jgi:Asp-tRNA(Asn)/Glu-tRNA(Gln) amidotransferase A subunit family amidase